MQKYSSLYCCVVRLWETYIETYINGINGCVHFCTVGRVLIASCKFWVFLELTIKCMGLTIALLVDSQLQILCIHVQSRSLQNDINTMYITCKLVIHINGLLYYLQDLHMYMHMQDHMYIIYEKLKHIPSSYSLNVFHSTAQCEHKVKVVSSSREHTH